MCFARAATPQIVNDFNAKADFVILGVTSRVTFMQTQPSDSPKPGQDGGYNNRALTSQPANDADASPLARALEQNEAAADAVEKSADELMVINAVLQQEIPAHAKTGDVAHALQKTDQLEVQIQDTAQELASVNMALAQEIAERGNLEDELAITKAKLASEKLARAAHQM